MDSNLKKYLASIPGKPKKKAEEVTPADFKKLLGGLTNRGRHQRYLRPSIEYDMATVKQLLIAIGQGYCSHFTIDEVNREAYEQMIKYFFADPSFAGDLGKGLMLRGKKGTGKTLAFMVFTRLMNTPIYPFRQIINGVEADFKLKMVKTRSLTVEYEMEGIRVVNKWKSNPTVFDDLGEEDKLVKFYSNETNLMSDIFLERYEAWLRVNLLTFATTNYMFEAQGRRYFEEFYGIRVEDRMKEMFNQIVFKGESRRK